MVEPLLSGIVLGLITVTLAGLFYAAYSQYKRDNELSMGAYDKYKEDDQFSVENYDKT